MAEPSYLRLSSAVEDFRRARRQASLQQIVARLTGGPAELLAYEDVHQKLKAEFSGQELKEIPLDAILVALDATQILPAAFCLGRIATRGGG